MQNFDSAINKFKNHYFHRFIAILVTCTEQYFALCHYADCRLCSVIMLRLTMLNVVILSVVTPYFHPILTATALWFYMYAKKFNMERTSLLRVCNSRQKFKKQLSAVSVNSPHV